MVGEQAASAAVSPHLHILSGVFFGFFGGVGGGGGGIVFMLC